MSLNLTKGQTIAIPLLLIISTPFAFALYLDTAQGVSISDLKIDLKEHKEKPAHDGVLNELSETNRKIDALYCKEKRVLDGLDYTSCFVE